MENKFMYIPNDVTQNFPFYRLHLVVKTFDAELNEPTNQNLKKSPKLLCQRIIKSYYKTLGTSVIQPNVPFVPLKSK